MKDQKNLLNRYVPNPIKAGCLTIDCHGEPFSVVYENLKILWRSEIRKDKATTDQNRSLTIQGVEKKCKMSFYSMPSGKKVIDITLKPGEDYKLELNCNLERHFFARVKSGNNFSGVNIEMPHSENVFVLPAHVFCER